MDATTRARIRERLIAGVDAMPERLRRAAKYIVDHPGDFGIDPIRETARKSGVSANTFVRLANRLGFDAFEDLRAPFRLALRERHDTLAEESWIRHMAEAGGSGPAQASAARHELDIVGRSLQLLTPETAGATIGHLMRARNAYVTATRASYALAYYFHYVARMAVPNLNLIPRHMGSPVDEMMGVGPEDTLMAITFAPYSAETIKALRLARQRGATVILVSDSELVAPRIEVDLLIRVSTQSTHHFGCYAGAMAVLDCLLAHLMRAGGAEARSRIADYEALREDFGAYWRERLPRLRR